MRIEKEQGRMESWNIAKLRTTIAPLAPFRIFLLFVMALGFCMIPVQQAQAAHTYDTKNRGTGNSNPQTLSYTCGSGATLLVLGIVTATTTARTGGAPTYNGVAMTQVDSTRTAAETNVEMWYLANPSTGSAYNISVPNSGALTLYLIASSYKAASGYTSALDVSNGDSNTGSANPSVAVTTKVNGDVVVDILGDGYYNAPSGNSPGTVLYSTDDGSYSDNAQYALQATAGLITLSWTVTSDDWAMVVGAFKEVANNCDFRYRKAITIQSGQVSSGPHTNFPMLVSVTDANLKTTANGGRVASYDAGNNDPRDIIFRALDSTTCNGTAPCTLDHEIEKYTASTGELVAWVRVPSINNVTAIYMYYGNSCITSTTQNPNGVWDTYYKGVWHLKESGSGTAGEFKDSTSVNNGQGGGGTAAYVPTLSATGEINGAQSFDGNDYISVPNNASLNVTSELTMEAWVYLSNSSNDQKIVGKTNNVVCNSGYILGVKNGNLSPEIWNSSGNHYAFNAGTISNSTWTHLAVTWTTGGNMVGYINGSTPSGGSISAGSTEIGTYTNPLYVGVAPYNHNQYYVTGTIDEVRISNKARSAGWIATEYNNQSSPSTFYTFGGEQDLSVSQDYRYRKQITIDHTKLGSSCSSDLSSFPVLINITSDNDLRTTAYGGYVKNSNGYDIIFRASDGTTQLDHEVESYTPSTGALVAWVRIPTLYYSSDTVIYLYYSNSSIGSSQENITGVWDTNYKAVWHFSGSGSSYLLDSTSNNNDGTDHSTTSTTGKIANARTYNGSSRYIDMGSGSTIKITGKALTVEAWINASAWGTNVYDNTIAGNEEWPSNMNGYVLRGGEGGDLSFNVGVGTAWYEARTTNNPMSAGTWYHVVGRYDGSNVEVFINGTSRDTTPCTSNITSSATNLDIGRETYDGGRWFNGNIDEVRISNYARPPCWIQTEYNNQNSPSTFYSISSQLSSYPTAVLLSSFSATEYEGRVLLQWKTGWETNNLGFNVYREEEDGQLTQINSELISGGAFLAGAKRATAGHSYAWVDNELSAISGQQSAVSTPSPTLPPRGGGAGWGAVRYWLEDVDLSGKRTMNGPVTPNISLEPLPEKAQAALMSQLARQDPEKDTISRRLITLQARLGRGHSVPLGSHYSSLSTPTPTLPPRGGGTGRGRLSPRSGELVVSGVDTGSRTGTLPSGPLNLSDRPGQIVSLPSGQQKKLSPQEVQWVLAGSPGLKLFIQEEGWYRLTQPELVAAGLDPRVNPRNLQLYVDGQEQAIRVNVQKDGQFGSQDSIEFYGTGLDTPSTETRVYWLVAGTKPGQRVSLVGTLTGQAGAASFPFSVEKKPRTIYFAALLNGDASNFFGPLVSTAPVDQVLSLSHLDPAPPAEAALEVSLQGVTEGAHQVQVQLNGVQVGSLVFADQSQGVGTLSVPQSLLLEGDNRVTLVAQGGEMDVSLIDSIRLTYWHMYTADSDSLRFTASGGQQLFIDGFSSSQVRVVDVTDPGVVRELVGQVRVQGSGYAVQFGVPGSGQKTLLAFAGGQVKSAAAIVVNQTSRWYQAGNGADLVMITQESFLKSLQPLKALRETQGLGVAVVDVEDLYDEFSFGNKSPQALRDFLLRVKTNWQKSPRFVLLVGDASVDPRNYLGLGDFDLVPTKLIDTDVLETASDDWFVDFGGDGLPKMAVGRLPVRTVDEAQTVISKIVGYEQSALRMADVLLVADMKGGEEDYDFEGASSGVQALLPGGLTVRRVYRSQFTDDSQVHAELLADLNQGPLLVNYLGHGSQEIWRGDIFTSDDAAALTNGLRLPFVVSMTCLNGFFQDPSMDSLVEVLLKAPQGGAVAVWASSGLTEPEGQSAMDQELVRLLFNGESLTLGEAVQRAKSATSDGDVRRTWMLFGDPTTKLKR
jgi:hypothetical protein